MSSKVLLPRVWLSLIIVFCLYNCIAQAQVLRNSFSDIYKDEKRDRQFSSGYYDRYPSNDRYDWDRRLFQSPQNKKFEPFIGDSRCLQDKNLEDIISTSVSVRLRIGIVNGINVSLCDGPGVPDFDRPNARPNYSPNVYRNIAVFLGIPYAEPPIKDRRFRVRKMNSFICMSISPGIGIIIVIRISLL